MITKAHLLDIAKQQALLPTTIEKDYVLGWLLYAIANHERLSRWVFKGGTCLKKCFFETYRFSEDLDFSVPVHEPFDQSSIADGLLEITEWVESEAGIRFPREGVTVEVYTNKRGQESVQAKVTYSGPLTLPNRQLQRVKFDLTQDEIIVDASDSRQIFHPYNDAMHPGPEMRCYSIDEILAEKTRALYERQGRARDVYDLVHLSRNFRDEIRPEIAEQILRKKFSFKGLPDPSLEMILDRVDAQILRANWEHQLGHQIPVLPSLSRFFSELSDAIAWWLEPEKVGKPFPRLPFKPNEQALPRQYFPTILASDASRHARDQSRVTNLVVYAARNHLCIELHYDDAAYLVEPYALRRNNAGEILLYATEVLSEENSDSGIKAIKLDEIYSATVTKTPFAPRYSVEL